MPSDRTTAMVRNFGILYGMSKTGALPPNYEKLDIAEMQHVWNHGRERDPRVGQVLDALSSTRAPLGPYAAIQAGIPCPVCPSGACVHGAGTPLEPPLVRVGGTTRSDVPEFQRNYLSYAPVTVPEMPPPPPSPAPVVTPELLRKALERFDKVYKDQWQRILEDDGNDDAIFVEIERIIGAARKKLIHPNAWWRGREPAVGPDGPVGGSDPRAVKWSISGALYAEMSDDPQVSAAVRAAVTLVATVVSGTLQTDWFAADMRLTRWNADPKRLYTDVLHVLAQVHLAVKQRA
jgi:hypothetical protein